MSRNLSRMGTRPVGRVMPPTSPQRARSAKPCGGDWWRTYNQRAVREVPEVFAKIRSACDEIRLPKQHVKRGQKPFPLRSLLKCWLAMIFFDLSSRRVLGFLNLHRRNLGLRGMPHFNTITRRAHDPRVHETLERMSETLREELDSDEEIVSIDSTGVATTHGKRWLDHKRGAGHDWRKLHTLQDVKTGFVIAAVTTHAREHDSPHYAPLVASIRPGTLVTADRGYWSRDNADFTEAIEGIPHIRPKKNARKDAHSTGVLSRLAIKAEDDDFWEIYATRNFHESRFSMFKRVLKPVLRWKSEAGQATELLLAVLVHNLRVLSKWDK